MVGLVVGLAWSTTGASSCDTTTSSGGGDTTEATQAHHVKKHHKKRRHHRKKRHSHAAVAPTGETTTTTTATTPPEQSCDPSYRGACLDQNASDYDCEGGSGDGPKYVSGPVEVVGDDHFGLDRDGDGVACES